MKETQINIYRDLYKSKDVPYTLTLDSALNRIKTGKSKEKIELLRSGNKDKKVELPCIMFSGLFSNRSGSGLIEHSGMMITDFDKYPDEKTMMSELNKLKKNKHFISLFVSPSGNGIKGVVKIPKCDKLNHPKYFAAFQEEFQFNYFDIANSNVDRVCFESYDPNIYINYDAHRI